MVFIFTQIFSVRQGRAVFTLAGFPTLEYLNLPYAVATRFLPATRAPAWQGVRDATQLGEICSQVETLEVNNSFNERDFLIFLINLKCLPSFILSARNS